MIVALFATVLTVAAAASPFSPEAEPIRLDHDIWTGAAPADAAAVRTLYDAGIRTVISVDALPSPLAPAGVEMRRVHLPIGYDGVPATVQDALLVAWRDCPKPLYIHCHRGKHRGPAAAVTLLRRLGRIDVTEGFATLRGCGTSFAYPGLYQSMREATGVSSAMLQALERPLYEHHQIGSLTAGMAALDRSWDNVLASQRGGWQQSQRHPDAAPAVETAAVTEHLRVIATMPHTYPQSFDRQLARVIDASTRLEAAIANSDYLMAGRLVSWMDSSCIACHANHRDGLHTRPVFVGSPPWEVDQRTASWPDDSSERLSTTPESLPRRGQTAKST